MIKNPGKIDFSNKFKKQLIKSPLKIKIAFKKRFSFFLKDEFHPSLNNHILKGEYQGFHSINITGDWRAIYSKKANTFIFEVLGTHSQLYK